MRRRAEKRPRTGRARPRRCAGESCFFAGNPRDHGQAEQGPDGSQHAHRGGAQSRRSRPGRRSSRRPRNMPSSPRTWRSTTRPKARKNPGPSSPVSTPELASELDKAAQAKDKAAATAAPGRPRIIVHGMPPPAPRRPGRRNGPGHGPAWRRTARGGPARRAARGPGGPGGPPPGGPPDQQK